MLELLDIAKSYDGKVAVRDINTCFEQGKCSVLIGPSGCGKSTILRLIAGLNVPDSGEIRFNQATIDARQDLTAYRHRLGYVIQEGGLFPHLTARANVSLVARYLGWADDHIASRMETLMNLVQLTPILLEQYPGELSGGQRQRVSLMRALMLDPDLLLLDEPLGALDPIIRYELQHELRDIFAAVHKTVVLVTHDLAEAAYLGDTLALMRDGRILQNGPFDELAAHPVDPFVEQFISAQRDPLQTLSGPL